MTPKQKRCAFRGHPGLWLEKIKDDHTANYTHIRFVCQRCKFKTNWYSLNIYN